MIASRVTVNRLNSMYTTRELHDGTKWQLCTSRFDPARLSRNNKALTTLNCPARVRRGLGTSFPCLPRLRESSRTSAAQVRVGEWGRGGGCSRAPSRSWPCFALSLSVASPPESVTLSLSLSRRPRLRRQGATRPQEQAGPRRRRQVGRQDDCRSVGACNECHQWPERPSVRRASGSGQVADGPRRLPGQGCQARGPGQCACACGRMGAQGGARRVKL
jgi:hypothetical protein